MTLSETPTVAQLRRWSDHSTSTRTLAAVPFRVSSTRTGQVYFTRHTLRIERPHNMPHNQVVTFGEAAEGTPTPIRAWFPLDESAGRAFVY